jgi:hypothetical protein
LLVSGRSLKSKPTYKFDGGKGRARDDPAFFVYFGNHRFPNEPVVEQKHVNLLIKRSYL